MQSFLILLTLACVHANPTILSAKISSNSRTPYTNPQLRELAQHLANSTAMLTEQPQCPVNSSIRFNPVPFLTGYRADDPLFARCGGNIFSDSNFTIHEDANGEPFLRSTMQFQHYSTEDICFTQTVETDQHFYEPNAYVLRMTKDIHTAHVSQTSRRYTDLVARFDDKWWGSWPAWPVQADAAAFSKELCNNYGSTLVKWSTIEDCGIARYVTGGAVCAHADKYVTLVELTGTQPTIEVEYTVHRFDGENNVIHDEGVRRVSNKQQYNSPGNLQLMSIEYPPTDTIHPHPLSVKMHVIKSGDTRLYKWVNGEMNGVEEDDYRKAYWRQAKSFQMQPKVSGQSGSICQIGGNLNFISKSDTQGLIQTPGSSDFQSPPVFNDKDMTVQARMQHSLRLRPAFEIRIPIQKTISKTGVLGLNGITCRNVPRDDRINSGSKEQILQCSISNVLVDGPIRMHVIYNCNIIKTISVILTRSETKRSFDIELAIYDVNATAHICTEHGVCTSTLIGKDIHDNPVYENPPIVTDPENLPPHTGNPRRRVQFGDVWSIFTFSAWWHYLVVGVLGIAAIFILLLVLKVLGPMLACFKWAMPKRTKKKHSHKHHTHHHHKQQTYDFDASKQKPSPVIVRPKPSISPV